MGKGWVSGWVLGLQVSGIEPWLAFDPDGAKVSQIQCRDRGYLQSLGDADHRSVDQPDPEIGVPEAELVRPHEVGRISPLQRERTCGEIQDERLLSSSAHPCPQEVVDLRED